LIADKRVHQIDPRELPGDDMTNDAGIHPPRQDSASAVSKPPRNRRKLGSKREEHCLTQTGDGHWNDANRTIAEWFKPWSPHERLVYATGGPVVDPQREHRHVVRVGECQRDVPKQRLYAADRRPRSPS
jgi:hypothetical protein